MTFKKEVSLTVFRVRLARPDSSPVAGSTSATSTTAPDQIVICELEVTGDPSQRGVRPLEEQVAQTKRSNQSSPGQTSDFGFPNKTPTRIVAQWVLNPVDIDLPVTYEQARDFHDRASRVYDALSAGARGAVSVVLKEFNADALIRSARANRWIPNATLCLPPEITRDLQRLLPTLLSEGDHLWVDIAEPVGYLPLIAWEKLLQPMANVPVLRLSPHPIQALGSNQELSVVIACSFSSIRALPKVSELRVLLENIKAALPPRSTIHVFADSASRQRFEEALVPAEAIADSRRVIVHPIPDVDPNSGELSLSADGVSVREHPWIMWMESVLGGEAVDIIHWISQGALFADGARLVVTRSPRPAEESEEVEESSPSRFRRKKHGRAVRYLNAQSMAAAATGFGAWSMVLTIPPRGPRSDKSQMALRLLADQLSRLRPGVVALHDLAEDPKASAISETYKFLSGSNPEYASVSQGVAVYCHPNRASSSSEAPLLSESAVVSAYSAAAEAARAKLNQPGPSPAWVATTQRVLEQVTSRFVAQPADQSAEKSSLDQATERGVVAAMQLVEQMLTEKSTQHSDSGVARAD